MFDLTPYLQIGSTGIIALALVWAITKIKKNGHGNNHKEMTELKIAIDNIEKNHFNEVGAKLDELIRQGQEADRKHDKMVELLIEIKNKK